MTDKILPQEALFNKIRASLPSHVSLVDEVSEILNISNDSAYRRIRNEKPLQVEEFLMLCRHFRVSADEILQLQSDLICFKYYFLEEKNFGFENYLETIHRDLKNLVRQENPHLYLIFNELNIFQLMIIPEIASFKFFFWSKSNLGFPGYGEKQFSIGDTNNRIYKLCRDILQIYLQIPTIELITDEALSSMLRQFIFYYDAGYFASKEDLMILCQRLDNLIDHLRRQAEFGFKFDYETDPHGEDGNFRFYYNDLVITDNTVLASSSQSKSSYITSNVVNLLVSDNPEYFNHNLQWAKNLIGKSTLISGAAERDRNRFFKKLHNEINEVKERFSG